MEMSCLNLKCSPSSPRKSRSLKTQWSSKRHTDHAEEPCREWPVDADQYELLEFAGKGAHAVVFKGRCKLFDETVAIKRLDLDANWDLTALIREATLMKKFNHPAVLPLYAAFVAGRELWLVTPFMGLGSVRSIMKQHFPLGLDEVVIATIMYPVLEALEYVHETGIHRDVKADNILVSEQGEVVLADFGVAAARMRPVSFVNLNMQAVMATTFVGTPCWMAPEVMTQSDNGYHTSADIWSFGITLIELAHGRPPLARMHPMRVLMDTMHKPPPQLDDRPHGTQFSKAFKDLVEECLHKDPDQRPTAAALMGHRFFRMARDADFLQQHFLAGLQQQQQRSAPNSPTKLERPLASAGDWGGPPIASPTAAVAAAVPGTKQQQDGPAGAAAVRAESGTSGSSGPSRLFSGWFFPPAAAAALEPGEQPATDGGGHQGAAAAGTQRLRSSLLLGSSASSPFGCASAAGPGSVPAAGSGWRSVSAGPEQQQHSSTSSGSSSLEQQLQPFVLQQQAALRAGSGLIGLPSGPSGSGLGLGFASGPSGFASGPSGFLSGPSGFASGPCGPGLRLGGSRQFSNVVPASLLESWGLLASHPEDDGAEEEAEGGAGPAAGAPGGWQGPAAAGGRDRGVTAAVKPSEAESEHVGCRQVAEDAVGYASGLPAARCTSCSHASRVSSCSFGGCSVSSSSRTASASCASGLTQEEVEAMLAPAHPQLPLASHSGGFDEARSAGSAAAAAPTPSAAQQQPAQWGVGEAHPGEGRVPAAPATSAAPSLQGSMLGAGLAAAASTVDAISSGGGVPHSAAVEVPLSSDALVRVTKLTISGQQQGSQPLQCSSPKVGKQSSFKEALSFLSDLKGRVLSPRASAARAAAVVAAAAAAEEQQQHVA